MTGRASSVSIWDKADYLDNSLNDVTVNLGALSGF